MIIEPLEPLFLWRDEIERAWVGVRDKLGQVLDEARRSWARERFGQLVAAPWSVRVEALVFTKAETRTPIYPPLYPADVREHETRNVYLVRPVWVALVAQRLDRACVGYRQIPIQLRALARNEDLVRAIDGAERLGGIDALRVLCASDQVW